MHAVWLLLFKCHISVSCLAVCTEQLIRTKQDLHLQDSIQHSVPGPHPFLRKCNFQLPWEIKFTGLIASLKSRGPGMNARDGAVISGRWRCWPLLPDLQGQFSPQPLRSDISSAIYSSSFSSFPTTASSYALLSPLSPLSSFYFLFPCSSFLSLPLAVDSDWRNANPLWNANW